MNAQHVVCSHYGAGCDEEAFCNITHDTAGSLCSTTFVWLLQVALRKILQAADPRLSSEEASTYISCGSYNSTLDE
jgi:hypothetical protein